LSWLLVIRSGVIVPQLGGLLHELNMNSKYCERCVAAPSGMQYRRKTKKAAKAAFL
jgi:hypothetical protein